MKTKARKGTPQAKAAAPTVAEPYDGSTPLTNARQEAFAQALTGFPPMSQAEAYIKAGYAKDDGHSARLAVNGRVSKRVAFLKAQAAKACQLTKERALAILSEIAEAKITDFMDETNGIIINGKHRVRAVQSVKVRKLYSDGEQVGTETELRMRDPRDAIETLAKLCGWNEPEKVETNVRGGVTFGWSFDLPPGVSKAVTKG